MTSTHDAVFTGLVDQGFGEFPDGVEQLIAHIDRRGGKSAFLRDLAVAFMSASRAVNEDAPPFKPSGERLVWGETIQNWRIASGGDEPEECDAENRQRNINVVFGRGHGGASLVSNEAFGEAEVHLELADEGLHLLVYVPDVIDGEPALNAYLRSDGLVVEELHTHRGGEG